LCLLCFALLFLGGCPSQDKPGTLRPERLRKTAEQGDAESQYLLGWCYFSGFPGDGSSRSILTPLDEHFDFVGKGVPQDIGEGISWWQKAAEQGHVRAQTMLGVYYFRLSSEMWWEESRLREEGEEVLANRQEAIKWFLRAAEQGNAFAQFELGRCYYVNEEMAEAVYWMRKAVEQGHKKAGLLQSIEKELEESENNSNIEPSPDPLPEEKET